MSELIENQRLIVDLIRDVPDWPKPGVVFKDITPLLENPAAAYPLWAVAAYRRKEEGWVR